MVTCNEYEGSALTYPINLNSVFSDEADRGVARGFIHRANMCFIETEFPKGTMISLNFGEKPCEVRYSKNILWLLNNPKKKYDYSTYDVVLCSDKEFSNKNGFVFFEPGYFVDPSEHALKKIYKYSFVGNKNLLADRISKAVNVTRFKGSDISLVSSVQAFSKFYVVPNIRGFLPLMSYNAPALRCSLIADRDIPCSVSKYIRVPGVKKKTVNWDMEPYELSLSDQFITISELNYE